MKRKVLFIILTIILVSIVGTVSWILLKPDTAPTEQETTSTAPKDTPSKVSPKPSNPIEDASELVDEKDKKDAEKVLKEIGTSDKKATPIEGFSGDELDEATKFISDYIYATHTNEYFLGGDWVSKDKAEVKYVQALLSNYYSKKLVDSLDKLEGKQGTPEFANEITSIVPFFDETPYTSPSEYCNSMSKNKVLSNEVTEIKNCVTDLKISEIKMSSFLDKESYSLNAQFDVKSRVALYSKELSSDAQTEVSYSYSLVLEKIILSEDKSEWQITGYSITPSLSEVSKYKGSNE